jgi:hypothetical protein
MAHRNFFSTTRVISTLVNTVVPITSPDVRNIIIDYADPYEEYMCLTPQHDLAADLKAIENFSEIKNEKAQDIAVKAIASGQVLFFIFLVENAHISVNDCLQSSLQDRQGNGIDWGEGYLYKALKKQQMGIFYFILNRSELALATFEEQRIMSGDMSINDFWTENLLSSCIQGGHLKAVELLIKKHGARHAFILSDEQGVKLNISSALSILPSEIGCQMALLVRSLYDEHHSENQSMMRCVML